MGPKRRGRPLKKEEEEEKVGVKGKGGGGSRGKNKSKEEDDLDLSVDLASVVKTRSGRATKPPVKQRSFAALASSPARPPPQQQRGRGKEEKGKGKKEDDKKKKAVQDSRKQNQTPQKSRTGRKVVRDEESESEEEEEGRSPSPMDRSSRTMRGGKDKQPVIIKKVVQSITISDSEEEDEEEDQDDKQKKGDQDSRKPKQTTQESRKTRRVIRDESESEGEEDQDDTKKGGRGQNSRNPKQTPQGPRKTRRVIRDEESEEEGPSSSPMERSSRTMRGRKDKQPIGKTISISDSEPEEEEKEDDEEGEVEVQVTSSAPTTRFIVKDDTPAMVTLNGKRMELKLKKVAIKMKPANEEENDDDEIVPKKKSRMVNQNHEVEDSKNKSMSKPRSTRGQKRSISEESPPLPKRELRTNRPGPKSKTQFVKKGKPTPAPTPKSKQKKPAAKVKLPAPVSSRSTRKRSNSESGLILEVCVDNLQSVRNAVEGGAQRIELCTALDVGGLTPTREFLKKCKKIVPSTVKIFCMIRPRKGDFIYSEDDIELMEAEIDSLKSVGADGFVFGALDPEGKVDKVACSRLLKKVGSSLPSTFHRAFDQVHNAVDSFHTIVDLGFSRLLTSGKENSALLGISMIKRLVQESKDYVSNNKVVVMAGAGVNSANVGEIIKRTGVQEVHASAKEKIPSAAKWRKNVAVGIADGDDSAHYDTSRDIVLELLEALKDAKKKREEERQEEDEEEKEKELMETSDHEFEAETETEKSPVSPSTTVRISPEQKKNLTEDAQIEENDEDGDISEKAQESETDEDEEKTSDYPDKTEDLLKTQDLDKTEVLKEKEDLTQDITTVVVSDSDSETEEEKKKEVHSSSEWPDILPPFPELDEVIENSNHAGHASDIEDYEEHREEESVVGAILNSLEEDEQNDNEEELQKLDDSIETETDTEGEVSKTNEVVEVEESDQDEEVEIVRERAYSVGTPTSLAEEDPSCYETALDTTDQMEDEGTINGNELEEREMRSAATTSSPFNPNSTGSFLMESESGYLTSNTAANTPSACQPPAAGGNGAYAYSSTYCRQDQMQSPVDDVDVSSTTTTPYVPAPDSSNGNGNGEGPYNNHQDQRWPLPFMNSQQETDYSSL